MKTTLNKQNFIGMIEGNMYLLEKYMPDDFTEVLRWSMESLYEEEEMKNDSMDFAKWIADHDYVSMYVEEPMWVMYGAEDRISTEELYKQFKK